MFDSFVTATTGAHGAAAVDAWARVENAACARRVAAMAAMLDAAHAADGSADRDQWCIDNWDAVAAHIGAAQRITTNAASNQLLLAVALHERFPQVAAVFADGMITYQLVKTVVQHGALVTDPDALQALDALPAEALRNREVMSVATLEKTIDALVAQVDPHAVHRTETKARGRSVDIGDDDGSGMATVFATLFAHHAKAFNTRIDALARTTCPNDPRTLDQRRSDAIGALSDGNDRLACLCNTGDCPAGENPPSTGVVVYVITHSDTIEQPPTPDAGPPPAPDVPDEPNEPNEPAHDGSDGAADANDAVAPQESSDNLVDTDPTDERAALDGEPSPMFTKPLRELTLTEALTPTPGRLASVRPAAMMGGQFLPGAIACRAAIGATITPIVHPGLAPPEPHYRPSKKLADFVRCRDQTCRFPGCHVPATNCDIDHVTPWPYGKTQASNLACLCRRHHLLKTFWGGENGWRERQLDDGTVIWTAPDGRTHTTTPGSRHLFPELSQPTAAAVTTGTPTAHTAGLTMPRRKTTRAEDRARRIHHERELNRLEAEAEVEPTS